MSYLGRHVRADVDPDGTVVITFRHETPSGLALTPEQAREVADDLLAAARAVEHG